MTVDEELQPKRSQPAPRTDCCSPADVDPRIARYFDRRNQRRRTGAETYQVGNVTRRLIERLVEANPAGHSVLEGGCGPGALLVEMLAAGATSATGIDLSAEAVALAREGAEEAGFGELTQFIVGDAAVEQVPAHDWVVLDKVICCYPDMDALLRRTVAEANSLFAFAVPISYGWRGLVAKLALGAEQVVLRLMGRPCPAYVHDVGRIERSLRDAGFRSVRSEDLGMWHVGVFARA